MLKTIPHVAAESCFALKGGTAINLFVRDMPRLSVDIDLAYLPVDEPRETALKKSSEALGRIASAIKKKITGTRVQESRAREPDRVIRLIVSTGTTRIKVEPNEVIRGSVFPAEERELTRRAEDLFELSVSARSLSLADLYGGKLCAALDRQHPRDLFDVKILLDNEGITDDIRRAFVVYLASHDRPIHELLDPKRKDVRRIYENEFAGMPVEEIAYKDLIAAREKLIEALKKDLTDDEKTFLVSIKAGEPNWSVLGIKDIEKLPAIQWKLANIRKIGAKKRGELLGKLKRTLGL
ncbi:MAG: nucleotidyl transferase AbiEii/AbiGii toxin family protein [Deltaproteobacteria bacterium]|nr:nucleotidyl transferase AbiEii/AbiGii toxin family protein [Deltaproteobacteria bacterium]